MRCSPSPWIREGASLETRSTRARRSPPGPRTGDPSSRAAPSPGTSQKTSARGECQADSPQERRAQGILYRSAVTGALRPKAPSLTCSTWNRWTMGRPSPKTPAKPFPGLHRSQAPAARAKGRRVVTRIVLFRLSSDPESSYLASDCLAGEWILPCSSRRHSICGETRALGPGPTTSGLTPPWICILPGG